MDKNRLVQACRNREPVLCEVVKKTDSGGLLVLVDGVRGYMSASHAGVSKAAGVESLVGQTVEVIITSYIPERRSLSVSRRLLDRMRKVKSMGMLNEGDRVRCQVQAKRDFGYFCKIIESGVVGLLHVSELGGVELVEGEELDLKVLDIDDLEHRVSFGLKEIAWEDTVALLEKTDRVTGTVIGIRKFGAMVRLAGTNLMTLAHKRHLFSQIELGHTRTISLGAKISAKAAVRGERIDLTEITWSEPVGAPVGDEGVGHLDIEMSKPAWMKQEGAGNVQGIPG